MQGIGWPVSLRRFTATFGLLAVLSAADGALPEHARALQAGFRAGGDADTLTVSADGGALPKYSVRRTGAQELTVTFDAAPGEKALAAPGIGGSRLISGVRPVPGGFKIQLKTSAFGYVNAPNKTKSQLNIQIFADAIGSSWADAQKDAKKDTKKDAKAEKKAEAAKKADQGKTEKATAEKLSPQQKKAEAQAKREQEAQAKRDKQQEAQREKEAKTKAAEEAKHAAAEAKRTPAPQPAPPVQTAPAAPQTASRPAPPADGAQGQPFYSVPYSMRAQVNKTVLGAPSSATAPAIAGQPAAPAPEKSAPARQVGGKLPPGVVERPLLQEATTAAQPPSTAESAPAIARAANRPPVDVTPAKGQPLVMFRAERHGPEDARPAEVISGAAAAPKVAPSASTPAQAAPASMAGSKPWELRQPVQKAFAPTGASANATLPQVAAPQAEAAHPANASEHAPAAEAHGANASEHAPAPAADAHSANASGHAPAQDAHAPAAKDAPKDAHAAPAKEGGGHGGKDKEPQGPLTLDQIKDEILKAQTSMMGGKWDEAAKTLEALMREPALKGDAREDALYSLADTYMQAYKDNLAANYDKIAGAQQAAMNANQKSNRVPRALINLGLLNLRVGNLPEAKAYFNIVKKKYAHDQNAAVIPFSLGEYYRNKGDLKNAAAQYQSLIQNYPDSRMAKDTAYILAQVLRKLGENDKAYQIADYLDKRWPLFYMENPDFLKLEAEIEEKVGKLQQAKDHYWTFYNLNPNTEYADIALVRIGDIYLRQNKRAAAKEIYQKVVQDFPDREGGLVARMRLAEEGIYDDPTMSEMDPVFAKPEALKPNETYELIIKKYPQSPLAPLAQIKLGMWQFHTKAYLDAMNTAASFLEKYPKSNLVGKAKELGFQAFLQALPGLVQDGNYARVLQMYDTSPFVKDNQNKIGDEAQMAIAVSAWKRGQPDRALKLAGRFLGKKQVPKYSEMALDLAMNIFMEQKQWKRISDLATRANAAWKLSPRQKTQFENAKAMALENQGETEKTLPLWTRIAGDTSSEPATRAHATYMLAKDASRRQDMVRLFALSQEALAQLLATNGDKEKIKDCLLMAITATERSGRFSETLKWGNEFDRIIPVNDPDWAPVRLRLADIYRRGNQTAEWKNLLGDVVKKKPGTVYARMAQQSLESSALDQRLQDYLIKPPPR
ncbi:tetratricopeptide repeat protein [Humidesulfovibrio idahonensis]